MKLKLKNNWKTKTKTTKINQNENHAAAEPVKLKIPVDYYVCVVSSCCVIYDTSLSSTNELRPILS